MSSDSLDLITALEGTLKAAVNLQRDGSNSWRLSLRFMYDGQPAGGMSFNLNGYDAKEAHDLARNISNNGYLMREIDQHLWGESD